MSRGRKSLLDAEKEEDARQFGPVADWEVAVELAEYWLLGHHAELSPGERHEKARESAARWHDDQGDDVALFTFCGMLEGEFGERGQRAVARLQQKFPELAAIAPDPGQVAYWRDYRNRPRIGYAACWGCDRTPGRNPRAPGEHCPVCLGRGTIPEVLPSLEAIGWPDGKPAVVEQPRRYFNVVPASDWALVNLCGLAPAAP